MSNRSQVLDHARKVGFISSKNAMLNLGMSGGTLTKVISELQKDTNIKITKYRIRDSFNSRLSTAYVILPESTI